MTIFDYLNSVLYSKKRIELNCDDESQFNLFMMNRWISFYSKELAGYINQTTNKTGSVFTSKQEQYDYIFNVVPKLRFKKLEYVKKVKKEDSEEEPIIPEFCSKREYRDYVELSKQLSK